jgi:thiamine kinase-like enzyme
MDTTRLQQISARVPQLHDVVAVDELEGGLTNTNYRVRTARGGDFVVRVCGESSGLLAIDRAVERANTVAAYESGVGAPVVAVVPELDTIVVEYIDGRTLGADDLADPATAQRVAAAVRVLHAGPTFQGSFDMRRIRRYYLDVVQSNGYRLPDHYLAVQPRIEALEDAMVAGTEPLVPCNNDLLPANFIDDGAKIWVIDYEYSGMNEASFEIGNMAAEAFLDDAQTEHLVASYWGRPSEAKLARARAWSLLARYGWTLWASIQDGASDLSFDFWSWGMKKYDSAITELTGPRYDETLRGLAADD